MRKEINQNKRERACALRMQRSPRKNENVIGTYC